MLTPIQTREYKRQRSKGLSASQALALVRYKAEERLWSLELDKEEDTDEVDGFSVTVKIHQDDTPDLSWLGEMTDDQGEFPETLRRSSPERNEYKYFVPGHNVRENARAYSKLGYSKTVAFERALADAYQDMRRLEDYGNGWSMIGISVTVSLQGRELASDSLFGIESDSGSEYLDETASDMIGSCLETAKELALSEGLFEAEEPTLP